MKIQAVCKAARGHNRYCGPAALSIVTGINTAEAAALIRKTSNVRSVKGTSIYQMTRAYNALGYHLTSAAKVNPNDRNSNPTLAAWLKETASTRGNDVFLISAGHHWQIVQGRRFCCGLTQKPVSFKHDKVKRRARVTGVWKITYEPFEGKALGDLIPEFFSDSAEQKRKRAVSSIAAKARRLAKKHDVEIEVESWGWGSDRYTRIMVWGPDFLDDLDTEACDPYTGDHYAEDWHDALERVETYVKLLEDEPHLFERNAVAKAA